MTTAAPNTRILISIARSPRSELLLAYTLARNPQSNLVLKSGLAYACWQPITASSCTARKRKHADDVALYKNGKQAMQLNWTISARYAAVAVVHACDRDCSCKHRNPESAPGEIGRTNRDS